MTRTSRRSIIRRLIEIMVLSLIALLLLRGWCVDGLPRVCRVTGGSMAPTLPGEHYRVECGDCGHRFLCGGAPPPPRGAGIWCPNCGYTGNRLGAGPLLLGDAVLIDRSAFCYRAPRRWALAAVRHPERADRLCVKRVAGLPGESIRIRHGELYVNGRLCRKDYAAQRAMALLVYDAARPPGGETDPPPRWRTDQPGNRWGRHQGRFAHPSAEDGSPLDWVVYRHWARRPGGQESRVEAGPITDRCGYNQVRPRRADDLHAVSDIMIEFQIVDSWGLGPLVVELSDSRRRLDVRLWPGQGRFELRREGRPIPGGSGPVPSPLIGATVVVSRVDQQLLLAVNDRVLAVRPFDPLDGSVEPPACPIRVGAGRLGVILEGLRVYRDVYFTRPPGVRGRWATEAPVRLGLDEFFLLGENSPIAEDSRTWPSGAGVDRRMLVGQVVLVWFPALAVRLGGRDFQVPDPARIRYIQ